MKVYPVLNEYKKVVSDQYVFIHNGNRYFQSYDNIIAQIDQNNGAITLDEKYYDKSKTTAKYRNMFLDMSTSKMKKLIKNEVITLGKLNNDSSNS